MSLEEHTFVDLVLKEDKHEPISVEEKSLLKCLVKLVIRSSWSHLRCGRSRSVKCCQIFRPFVQPLGKLGTANHPIGGNAEISLSMSG